MTTDKIKHLFEQFQHQHILVIGDVMLDEYIYGKVERISPEAPVPIVHVNNDDIRPGGAANVALNLAALGAKVTLCSIVGDDEGAINLKDLLYQKNISTDGIISSEKRITTRKIRIIGNRVQMLRIDKEDTSYIDAEIEDLLIEKINQLLPLVDGIILEDYNKGVLTKKIIETTIQKANELGKKIAVDPKLHNFLTYKNVTLFKPNLKEIKEGLKLDFSLNTFENWKKASLLLQENLQHQISFITLSENGVFITNHKDIFEHVPAYLRNINDVSGAGDTVISIAMLCLVCNIPLKQMAQLCNLGGGIVCEEIGVVTINKEKLLTEAIKQLVL